jgi:carboxymethylenebutenolidase
MTELQRYLAEEVAEDHADGIITRREAMRRLGWLGVGSAAASVLLAGPVAEAGAHGPHHDRRGQSHADGTVEEWAPIATQAITFPGPNGALMAAFAPAADPVGGVLVIHENRGLTDHIRVVAGRFAAAGYSALAIDLLSEEGGTAAIGDEAQIAGILASVPPERFDADMKAGVTELAARVQGKRMAAIGFCFGGGMVWRLLAASERRLSAAAPFYGPFPEGGDLRGAKAAVLGVYGGLDARVGATRPAGPGRDRRGGPQEPDPDLQRGRPRVLQRHRRALQPARGSRGLSADAALVRALRGRREVAPRIGIALGRIGRRSRDETGRPDLGRPSRGRST